MWQIMNCRLISLRMPTVPCKHVAQSHIREEKTVSNSCIRHCGIMYSIRNIFAYIDTQQYHIFENRRLCLVVPKERECFAPHPHFACQNEVPQVEINQGKCNSIFHKKLIVFNVLTLRAESQNSSSEMIAQRLS